MTSENSSENCQIPPIRSVLSNTATVSPGLTYLHEDLGDPRWSTEKKKRRKKMGKKEEISALRECRRTVGCICSEMGQSQIYTGHWSSADRIGSQQYLVQWRNIKREHSRLAISWQAWQYSSLAISQYKKQQGRKYKIGQRRNLRCRGRVGSTQKRRGAVLYGLILPVGLLSGFDAAAQRKPTQYAPSAMWFWKNICAPCCQIEGTMFSKQAWNSFNRHDVSSWNTKRGIARRIR